MITTTALAIYAAAFTTAWILERRARKGAEARLDASEANRSLAEATSACLRADNRLIEKNLAKKQAEIEALGELRGVIEHLESAVQVTDYNGTPIYTWRLSSPYPTLAEAVRHVPARR